MFNCVCKTFYVLALTAAIAYVVVQSAGDRALSRGGVTAGITRPVPALCMSAICFLSCFSVRWRPKRRQSTFSVAYEKQNACQFDTWCVSFGVAFALFFLCDLSRTEIVAGLDIPNGALFFSLLGLLAMALATSLFPREVGDFRPPLSRTVAWVYGAIAALFWLADFLATSLSSCGASAPSAAFRATYLVGAVAVAWRSTDIVANDGQPGCLALAFGAHLFVASEVLAGLAALCGYFSKPTVYYPLVMITYYVAILAETYGVTKYAMESEYYFPQSGSSSGNTNDKV